MTNKRNKTMTTPKQETAKPVDPIIPLTGTSLKIWNEIKDLQVSVFTLPNQFVHQYCQPAPLDPSKLFLKFSVSAFLPALEEVIGANREKSKYNLELQKNYIVISENHVIGK
jgi:hypothetical protein